MFGEPAALSNFTFLDGASHPQELAATARALGHTALGIADRNSMAGLVRGMVACEQAGLRFLPGVRLHLTDGSEYLAWPTDRAAYGRLCALLSAARMEAPKGECPMDFADLLAAAEGQVLARIAPATPDAAFATRHAREARALRERLAMPLLLAAAHRAGGADRHRLDTLAAMPEARLITAGGVRYHAPTRQRLADVLTAIRLGCTVDRLGLAAEPNAEACLKPKAELRRLFQGHEGALDRVAQVLDTCRFSLRDLAYEYPDEILDPGRTPQETLEARVATAVRECWPQGVPDRVAAQIAHELALIGKLNYAPYFLTVHEIVRYARGQGILCQGRGSAANSAVCFVLGITAVPPDKHELLFERFISEARDEPPDIDVDFEHERREEVIQHIYARYGRDRAAIAATVIRFRDRSAIREVGKALGLSEEVTAPLAKAAWGSEDLGWEGIAREQGLDPEEPRLRLTCELASEIQDFPRHLATHVGGFVITRGKLTELCVVTRAAMEDRHTIEWDKDDIEALRMLKVDVLGLGMLSCIRRAMGMLGLRALTDIPPDDGPTYEMLSRADSLGVFQVESRAQMNMLPRLRPKKFYDLVIQVAIVRPGPIQGDMVHPYLRRRNKEEPVEVPPGLEAVLGKTLGVPLFQEQAMKIAIVGAGFSPARADQLRRAMATFKRNGDLPQFRAEFLEGMACRGYDPGFAERCFRQLEGFGTYGFPESHAASFAHLVYISAWIKCYHPAVFAAALLNSQPMGFYAPAQIVRDAREHGVRVLPVDVTRSDWDCTLEGGALRLGLRQVSGLSEAAGQRIAAARPFQDLPELVRRAALDRRAVEQLAEADALRGLGLDRREALWSAAAVEREVALEAPVREAAPQLPLPSAGERVVLDYASTGLTLGPHPLALLRPRLAAMRCSDTRALAAARQGAWLRVAGLVLVRQRPGSAKGVMFFTLEDEHGTANLVLYADLQRRFRREVVSARLLLAEGRVERTEALVPILHLIARRIEDGSHLLGGLDDTAFDGALARADEVGRGGPAPRRAGVAAVGLAQPSRDFR
ncbi:error-prone DNA polymerase [Roseococcus suduntuyensis]|uniref:Error-prone DNA polymerase n=1 Tax=Roseococcus suduntuyensis TaxID=455361 RepID=A0A840AF25_9PROT|nr:error-prone DNA polymerase [Roseococcus suduntuyensis]MBB3900498.1 error-prone DNA polymerase [Roseococcus suduntuyensis]